MRHLLIATLAIALATSLAHADAPAPTQPSRTLVVATHPVAPFIIKKPNGEWGGISIELLRRIGAELGAKLDIREVAIAELGPAGKNDAYDVTASINVTENTDEKFELSHAFYSTGLAIAVIEGAKESRWEVAKRVFSGTFVWLLGGTLVLLTIVAFIM